MNRFGDRIELDLRPGVLHWMVTGSGALLTLAALACAPPPSSALLFPGWTLMTLAAVSRLADQHWCRMVIVPDGRCWLSDRHGRQCRIQPPSGNFVNAGAILLHMKTPESFATWLFRQRQPDAFRRLARWLQLADVRV